MSKKPIRLMKWNTTKILNPKEGNNRTMSRWEKKKSNGKMVDINSIISIIRLNINRTNIIKSQRLGWGNGIDW